MEDLANILDGLQSIDPTASMDIGDVKRRYSDRLILIGNVSVDNLCTRTKEEVIQEKGMPTQYGARQSIHTQLKQLLVH